MKKKELIFILDRSGSMSGKEGDVVGTYNSVIRDQKKEEYDVLITAVVFNERSKMIFERVPASNIPIMEVSDYRTSGCTALYDAVGDTIDRISMIHRNLRAEDKPDKVLMVIVTDGMENASENYSRTEIAGMIDRKKEEAWEFAFMGADLDAVTEAGKINIAPGMAVPFHKRSESFGTVATGLKKLTNLLFEDEEYDDEEFEEWREEIDEDFKRKA